jgi:hypothetical protein
VEQPTAKETPVGVVVEAMAGLGLGFEVAGGLGFSMFVGHRRGEGGEAGELAMVAVQPAVEMRWRGCAADRVGYRMAGGPVLDSGQGRAQHFECWYSMRGGRRGMSWANCWVVGPVLRNEL